MQFTNPGMAADAAFFLQGGFRTPGVTPLPTPGIYYSWPQLSVNGSIRVGDTTYTVTGGSAWMDHQLMATSLENDSNAARPIPFVEEPTPLNGWSWQYFNLKNGDAFTLASFQKGSINPLPFVGYGYYLTRGSDNATWISSYLRESVAAALHTHISGSPAAAGRRGSNPRPPA
ncbi:MAG: lipocalin-like domain-containing protein [Thermoanaerobaculia bacterium]